MSRDYDVGHGKPPKQSQFAKGRSGNPAGRPLRKRSDHVPDQSDIDDIMRAELARKVNVKDAKGTKKLTMLEVAMKAQLTSAAKGSAIAQRDVIRQAKELEERDAERRAEEERIDRRTYLYVVRKRAERRRIWNEALAQGREPDNPWPHPDDILIGTYPEWTIRGPVSAESVPMHEHWRMQRQHNFWMMMLESFKLPQSDGWFKFYCGMVVFYDRLLPQRWQWGQQLMTRTEECLGLTKADVEARADQSRADAEAYRIANGLPGPCKEAHKMTDKVMRPLLRRYGYQSLAEFQHAYETYGDDLPLPKPIVGP